MFFVCLVLAVGLGYSSYRARDTTVRLLLAAFCALNLFAAGHSVYVKDPYAFKLRPSSSAVEDNWRRP